LGRKRKERDKEGHGEMRSKPRLFSWRRLGCGLGKKVGEGEDGGLSDVEKGRNS
jgi:hypothetical protein